MQYADVQFHETKRGEKMNWSKWHKLSKKEQDDLITMLYNADTLFSISSAMEIMMHECNECKID